MHFVFTAKMTKLSRFLCSTQKLSKASNNVDESRMIRKCGEHTKNVSHNLVAFIQLCRSYWTLVGYAFFGVFIQMAVDQGITKRTVHV